MRDAFTAAFRGRRVKVHTIEGLLNTPQVRGRVDRRKVNQTLDFFREHRGFAPAKDLVSFLVVAVHGGFFFDANCVIEDWDLFRTLTRTPTRHPQFLRQRSQVAFIPESPHRLGELELLIGLTERTTVLMDETDMWAFYGPRNHEVFWKIAQHYVSRAEAFGMAGPRTTANSLRRSLRETFAQGDGNEKRTIAGALGVFSIYAGMHWLNQPHEHNWVVDSVKQHFVEGDERRIVQAVNGYWVPSLGLTKSHGNSWV